MANGLSGEFAYDVNAIAKLKYSAKKNHTKGVDEASQQFAAMFINQMLKSMRKAIPKSHLLGDSFAKKQYQDMMDAQWSQVMAKRGIGVAKLLEQQLSAAKGQAADPAAAANPVQASAAPAAIPKADPRPLAPSESLQTIRAQRAAAAAARKQAAQAGATPLGGTDSAPMIRDSQSGPLVPTGAASTASAVTDSSAGAGTTAPADYVRRFVAQFAPSARRAAQKTGLSPRLILAQAALETGWGTHQVKTASGQPSFNVFNIKAAGWSGSSAAATTHEYAHGTKQQTQSGFRVYNSYEQAFADYAHLIDSSPRYAAARQADSPQAAAQALQEGGYATDPHYASKLEAVMNQIPASSPGGLFAGEQGGQVVDMKQNGTPVI